jgi:transposase-like protein
MFEEPYFQDAEEARKHLESIRWPNGPFCPHCGCYKNIKPLNGTKHRPGLYKCYDCKQQFTVTVGTLFERSHVPLHKWFQAVYFLCCSKKDMSSHQIHRMLGVTYKTAWFMTHRIREAMTDGRTDFLGGTGSTVEVDETYWGNIPGSKKQRGYQHKEKTVSLVERDGNVRSFHVEHVSAATLRPILREHLKRETRVFTDEAGQYAHLDEDFSEHQSVAHSIGEYVRGDCHTNTIESYFAIMKRGLNGIYHHVGEQHLKRYLSEFDFRYNTRKMSDPERTMMALKGIEGKRLYYRQGSVA